MPPRRANKRKAATTKATPAKKPKTEPKKAAPKKATPKATKKPAKAAAKKAAPKAKAASKKPARGKAAKPVQDAGAKGDVPDCDLDLYSCLEDPTWRDVLKKEFEAPYFKKLEKSLSDEYAANKEVFPPKDLIFNAYNLTPFKEIKVVVIGQDPYHDNRQAHGLSFSVPHGVSVPPSLKNIYKELEDDDEIIGFHPPPHGCLSAWTEEGVFLLNATLTVEAHKPNSHAKFGWQQFTDATITAISENLRHVIFLLWGNFAQAKEKLIDTAKHYIIKTAHPSPLSASKFKACRCFSQVNHALRTYGREPVDWTLEHPLD